MAEARLNREYALRLAGVGALMVGMCVWSLYDGAVGWPGKNAEMERVRPALLATNLTAEAWIECEEGGVSPLGAAFRSAGCETPSRLVKKLGELRLSPASVTVAAREAQAKRVRALFEQRVYSPHDLQAQFVQAAVTLALGLLAFASVGVKARRVYVADETGLHGSGFGGRTWPYQDLAAINWSKWDEKGILTLSFKSGRSFRLDGWHFAGMTAVADELARQRPDLALPAGKGGGAKGG